MRYKTLATILSSVLLFGSFSRATSGTKRSPSDHRVGSFRVMNTEISKQGEEVLVSFDLVLPKIGSNYRFTATPIVSGTVDGVDRSKPLPSVVFSGRKSKISSRRTFDRNVARSPLPSDAIQAQAGGSTHYKVSVPYESWMQRLSLNLERTVEGCCTKEQLAEYHLAEDVLLEYDITPFFDRSSVVARQSELELYDQESSFLYPASEYGNRHEIFESERENGSLLIYFGQGDTRIDPTFRDNAKTLREVERALRLIEADPNASLKHIVIVGLASIEGTLARNDSIAQQRADALRSYVSEHVSHYRADMFETINGSEDWEGLKKLVEQSDMADRWQVLDIIKRYPIKGGREKKLMDLNRGDTYRYMYDHFFPELRNAGYIQIYYESTPWVDPYAESMNRALDLIEGGDYVGALELLGGVESDARVDNLKGLCYMMMGDYDNAEFYLKRSADAGDVDARGNLEELKSAREVSSPHKITDSSNQKMSSVTHIYRGLQTAKR